MRGARNDAAAVVALSRMSAALLALLIERPAHGYDLWKRCEARFGDTMYVTSSKVYHELGALRDRGLIEEIDDDTAGRRRPRRYPYRATAVGARAYRERVIGMLRDDPRTTATRERLLAVGPEDARTLAAIVDRLEHDCLDAAAEVQPSRSSLRDRLVAEHKRMLLTAEADFVKRARELLAAQPGRESVAVS